MQEDPMTDTRREHVFRHGRGEILMVDTVELVVTMIGKPRIEIPNTIVKIHENSIP